MEILPSIDLRAGKVVRLRQGDFSQQTDYAVDAVSVAQSFAKAGATIIHLVDLDGAKAGRILQTSLIRSIVARAGVPVQVGGGVRSDTDIAALLDAGVARVVVGTAALENWEWFEAAVAVHPGKLVLALDAKGGIVATQGWTASSGRRAADLATATRDWPLAALLYTDVAVDGTLAGPNLAATAELAGLTAVPVLASGGVGSLVHIAALKPTGAWGVVVGRALYENKFDLKAALALARS